MQETGNKAKAQTSVSQVPSENLQSECNIFMSSNSRFIRLIAMATGNMAILLQTGSLDAESTSSEESALEAEENLQAMDDSSRNLRFDEVGEPNLLPVVARMHPERDEQGRPIPGKCGSTDSLAKALGKEGAHFGQNVAATAVPKSERAVEQRRFSLAGRDQPVQDEDVVLSFGIIDILQEYTAAKRFEHNFRVSSFWHWLRSSLRQAEIGKWLMFVQTFFRGQKDISVVPPSQYARRFKRAILSAFD